MTFPLKPHLTPTGDREFYVPKNFLSSSAFVLKIGTDRYERSGGCLKTRRFRDPGFELTLALGKRVDIECGSDARQRAFGMKKSMIAQMVIDVGDAYRKGEALPY